MPGLWSPETAKAAALRSSMDSAGGGFLCMDPLADAREVRLESDEDSDLPMVEVEAAESSSRILGRIRIYHERAGAMSLLHIYEVHGLRALVGRVLRTAAFDNFVSLVVVANSVSIALEQARRMEKKETELFQFLEVGFLCFYILELGLIFFAQGWRCLNDNWVRFDLTLVLMGIVSSSVEAATGSDAERALSSLIVLRMVRLVRLARLARTMRLVIKFRELWLLAWGLVNCMSTAFHTLVFGVVLLYVVGCVAMELIPLALQDSDDPVSDAVRRVVAENFDSLPRTMLTLVQFITLDNAVNIYRPLIEADPYLTIFFVAVILIVGIVFMNMVTALIVTSGLEQAMKDSKVKKGLIDAKRKRLLVDLEKAFHRADVNGSGTVSRRELANIDEESKTYLQEILGFSNLADMFDFLDVDGSEEIDIDEFCNGAASIVLSDTAPEVKRMERMLKSVQQQLRRSQSQQEHVAESVGKIESLLVALASDLSPRALQTHEALASAGVRRCYDEEASPDVHPDSKPFADAERSFGHMSTFAPDAMQRPAWASELVEELKAAYSSNVSRTVEAACAAVMAEAAGDPVSSPQSSQWEPLPPLQPPLPWPSEGSAPEGRGARSRSPEPRPCGAADQRTGQDDQQAGKAQPRASCTARRGVAVPASRRPVLLSCPASGVGSDMASICVCRQEL